MPRALILAPTRELASQIFEKICEYDEHNHTAKSILMGGVGMEQQIKQLQKPVDIVVATPGRLLDHMSKGSLLLHNIEYLVIDEADRMLDMGFIPDIEKILKTLRQKKQIVLFSATMAEEVKKLTAHFMENPKEIFIEQPASVTKSIDQFIVACKAHEKEEILQKLLKEDHVSASIIFCNSKKNVKNLYAYLKKTHHKIGILHGDMNQHARTETLKKLEEKDISVLICSDIAARGIDITHISHVFNFDIPFHCEDYVHRIGRTGRAGRKGISISFATQKDQKLVDAIEKLIDHKIRAYDLKKNVAYEEPGLLITDSIPSFLLQKSFVSS